MFADKTVYMYMYIHMYTLFTSSTRLKIVPETVETVEMAGIEGMTTLETMAGIYIYIIYAVTSYVLYSACRN